MEANYRAKFLKFRSSRTALPSANYDKGFDFLEVVECNGDSYVLLKELKHLNRASVQASETVAQQCRSCTPRRLLSLPDGTGS